MDSAILTIVTLGPAAKVSLVGREELCAIEVTGDLGQEELVSFRDRRCEHSRATNDPYIFVRVLRDQLVQADNRTKAFAQRLLASGQYIVLSLVQGHANSLYVAQPIKMRPSTVLASK